MADRHQHTRLLIRSKECLKLFPRESFDRLNQAGKIQLMEGGASEVVELVGRGENVVVLAVLALIAPSKLEDLLVEIRAIAKHKHIFIVVLCSPKASTAMARLTCLREGAHVMSEGLEVIQRSLGLLHGQTVLGRPADGEEKTYTCPLCSTEGLLELELEHHYNLFHSRAENSRLDCPVCSTSSPCLGVHLRECHVTEDDALPRPHPCRLFAWVVVRDPKNDRYLLVNEPTGLCKNKGPLYWLPAGQLDVGESFMEAGVREVKEEAGIDVRLTGILRFIGEKGIVFAAEPCQAKDELKEIPDFESVCATWVPLAEVLKMSPDEFRDTDPLELFPLLDSGRSCSFVENNTAFREFEAAVQVTTTCDSGSNDNNNNPAVLKEKFQALRSVYPSHLFHDFY